MIWILVIGSIGVAMPHFYQSKEDCIQGAILVSKEAVIITEDGKVANGEGAYAACIPLKQ